MKSSISLKFGYANAKFVVVCRVLRALLILAFGLFYCFISSRLGLGVTDGGPDEIMRSLIPRAIVNGNFLPSGYDPEVIPDSGNWSYAFYPQMLGAYVSALFMFLARSFGFAESQVFVAGRLASVLFGIIAVKMVSMTVLVLLRRITTEGIARIFELITMVLMGLWPQFVFLSSYMNNDIVGLCGVSTIVYSLTSGTVNGWNTLRSIHFSLGVITVALGYWNACTFALVGIPLFIGSVASQRIELKLKAKYIGIAAILAAMCVLPFYIVNLVRYNDLLGIHVFHDRYLEWLDGGGEVLQHPWESGLKALLFQSNFVFDTIRSFVGMFGYMTIEIPELLLFAYLSIVLVPLGGFIARVGLFIRSRKEWYLVLGMLLASAMTLLLFLYYTLNTDYQPQGRYIIYLLVPLIISVSLGLFSQSINESRIDSNGLIFELNTTSLLIIGIILVTYVACTIGFFNYAINAFGWCGV